jgi:hypothetical protein
VSPILSTSEIDTLRYALSSESRAISFQIRRAVATQRRQPRIASRRAEASHERCDLRALGRCRQLGDRGECGPRDLLLRGRDASDRAAARRGGAAST